MRVSGIKWQTWASRTTGKPINAIMEKHTRWAAKNYKIFPETGISRPFDLSGLFGVFGLFGKHIWWVEKR